MPVRPLILSPLLRALRGDPADLLVRAGGGQRRRALPALRALFSMTPAENSAAEFNSQKNNIHLYSPLASGGINVILGGQSGFGTETPVRNNLRHRNFASDLQLVTSLSTRTKSPVTKSPSLGCLQLQPKKRTRLILVFAHCPVAGFAARRIIHGRTSKSNLGRVRFLLAPAYKQNSDDRSSLHL